MKDNDYISEFSSLTEEHLNLVEKMKNKIPNLTLSTDIIVGFPGETDEEFEDTIKTKEQLEYSIEERIENNRDYEMLGIGYTFEHRFSIMQWIYIDRETKQIYEYDLPNERLIAFE